MIRAALAALMLLTGPLAAQGVAEPEGYRGEPYRAPVPKTLAGAVVVDAIAAHVLWQGGEVAFVDVLPRAPGPSSVILLSGGLLDVVERGQAGAGDWIFRSLLVSRGYRWLGF